MRKYKHASLCSGIGAAELAAEWLGWENVFHCEKESFPSTVLNYYFPKSESFHDITCDNFEKYAGQIDVLTCGFPCQPFSDAGLKLGTADPRHLWPSVYRILKQIRPRIFMGENVRGLISWNAGLVFNQVQTDLESAGYSVFPVLLSAAGINAPHQRYRIFFIAYDTNAGAESLHRWKNSLHEPIRSSVSERSTVTDYAQQSGAGFNGYNAESSVSEQIEYRRNNICSDFPGSPEKNSAARDVADTAGSGIQGMRTEGHQITDTLEYERLFNGADIGTCATGKYWENFPTQYPVRSGNDGFPGELDGITLSEWRKQTIKAYGNTKMPQLIYQMFQAIELYEMVY